MEQEEHYDTPWEFKNKAIAAVLSGCQGNGSGAGAIGGVVAPAKANGNVNGSGHKMANGTDENFFQEKPLISNVKQKAQKLGSFQNPTNSCIPDRKNLKGNNFNGFHPASYNQQPSHHHLVSPPHRRFSCESTSYENNRNHNAGFLPNFAPSSSTANTPFPTPTQQQFHQNGIRNRLSFDRLGAYPQSRVQNGGGGGFDSHSPISPMTPINGASSSCAHIQAYPLVSQMGYFPDQARGSEAPLNNEKVRPRRSTFDEANMVHEGMERAQAEQLLKPMEVGDFLLRRRTDTDNLALSLRAIEGVLHIKLEMRDGLWVLGEGPKFTSISGMLRCYRKNELPVRGAEHVRLKSPLTTTEVNMLLQAGRRKSQSP